MKRAIGHLLSYLEEYSFLGFISALIAIFVFRFPVLKLFDVIKGHNPFSKVFLAYIFGSMVLYPILLILSIVCEKTGFLYEGQYAKNSILFDLGFNVYNDIIFPFYAAKNRKYAPKAVAVVLVLWAIIVLFLILGFFITFT